MIRIEDNKLEKLYKFRSLDSGSINFTKDIFENNRMWYSRPLDFNDPFDCAPYASMEATDEEFRTYLTNLYKVRFPEMGRHQRRESVKSVMCDKSRNHRSPSALLELKNALLEGVNTAGVLSLSARCDHVLMWSHYASSHSGICIRLDIKKDKLLSSAQKVVYSPDRPELNLIRHKSEQQHVNALLTKADFWSYEEEWRVIDPGKGSGTRPFEAAALEGVILGAKISDANKKAVIDWIKGQKHVLKVFQARMHPTKYRLDFFQIIKI